MSNCKIIITGSSGLIGNNLVRHLSKKFEVIPLSSKKNSGFRYWTLGQDLPINNLNNTIIFHLSFDTKLTSKSNLKNNINYTGTMKIIKQSHNFKNCTFFQFSSQTSSPNATSNYGKVKYLIDSEIKNFDNVKIIRPGMVYHDDKSKIVDLIKKLCKLRIFPLISNKKNIQIIDINELIQNIEILCNKKDLKYYNFGSKIPINLKEFVTLVCKINNIKIPYFINLPEKIVLKISKILDFFLKDLFNISVNERVESLINLEVMDITKIEN